MMVVMVMMMMVDDDDDDCGGEDDGIQPNKQTYLHTIRHADRHAHTCMACTRTHTVLQ